MILEICIKPQSHHTQSSDEEIETAIDVALSAGYRHIDTAPVYGNEKAIGRVLKRWLDAGKVKREDLYIVTKLPPIGKAGSMRSQR